MSRKSEGNGGKEEPCTIMVIAIAVDGSSTMAVRGLTRTRAPIN
jgi:hypothetical protein